MECVRGICSATGDHGSCRLWGDSSVATSSWSFFVKLGVVERDVVLGAVLKDSCSEWTRSLRMRTDVGVVGIFGRAIPRPK